MRWLKHQAECLSWRNSLENCYFLLRINEVKMIQRKCEWIFWNKKFLRFVVRNGFLRGKGGGETVVAPNILWSRWYQHQHGEFRFEENIAMALHPSVFYHLGNLVRTAWPMNCLWNAVMPLGLGVVCLSTWLWTRECTKVAPVGISIMH